MSTTRPRSGFTPALALGTALPFLLAAPSPLAVRGRCEDAAASGGAAHGVQGEPARDRRSEAPAELADRVGRTRQSSSRPTRSGWRGASVACGRRAIGSGTPARWRRTSRSTAPTTARRCGRAERYYWQVRVWDGSGKASAWSAPAWWEMGLLEPSDWKASWIEPGLPEDVTKSGPVPMLRREFTLRGAVGAGAGLRDEPRALRDAPERPPCGRSALHARVDELQQAPAVPDLRRHGSPEGGRERGRRRSSATAGTAETWPGRGARNVYGDRLGSARCRSEVTYKDGREEVDRHATASGRRRPGPILMSEIYHGETYDARLEKAGWTAPGFDDQGVVGGAGREPPQGRSRRSRRAAGAEDPGAEAGQGPEDAGRRHGRGHGPEHGRLGEAQGRRDPPARRSRCATPRSSTSRATSTRRTCARRRPRRATR